MARQLLSRTFNVRLTNQIHIGNIHSRRLSVSPIAESLRHEELHNWRREQFRESATVERGSSGMCLTGCSYGFGVAFTSVKGLVMLNEGVLTLDGMSFFASSLVGVTLGCLLAAPLSHRFGPKSATIFAMVCSVMGWAIIAGVTPVPLLCCGRLLTGTSTGILYVTVHPYICEITRPYKAFTREPRLGIRNCLDRVYPGGLVNWSFHSLEILGPSCCVIIDTGLTCNT